MPSGRRGRAAEGRRPLVSARRECVPEGIPGSVQASGDRDAGRRGDDVSGIHRENEAGEVMTKASIALAAAAIAFGASGRPAAQNGASADIQVLKVQGNVYMLAGPGGN